jgi:hypothetical protein
VQNDDSSGAVVDKWATLLQAGGTSPEQYASLRPIIVNDLCTNYHVMELGNKRRLTAEDCADVVNDAQMIAFLTTIKRRSTNGAIKRWSTDSREKITAELKRIRWPSGKPPELQLW